MLSSEYQNPVFDALYCEEAVGIEDFEDEICNNNRHSFTLVSEHDLEWEDEELHVLLCKETMEGCCNKMSGSSPDGFVDMVARNEGVEWMMRVIGFYGFSAITAVLAVNYYHRFVSSLCLQQDKPWMTQLVAVACLSIAAKVEETHVPLLLDLQVEETKYLFEAKTIQKMELVILSKLDWKVNPVTPISFIHHIARRFELITNLDWEFLRKCESIMLSIIGDCRIGHYPPSVVAAATMVQVISEVQPRNAPEYKTRLATLFKASKERISECHKVIMDGMNNLKRPKRKHEVIPSSPSGVIDAYLSSDSSVDSWAVASSSPEPFFKRSRTQDQHMRLASRN